MKQNRRGFFRTLGAAIAGAAVAPFVAKALVKPDPDSLAFRVVHRVVSEWDVATGEYITRFETLSGIKTGWADPGVVLKPGDVFTIASRMVVNPAGDRELIEDAMCRIGLLMPDESASNADFQYARRALNRLRADWRHTRAIMPMDREVVELLARELSATWPLIGFGSSITLPSGIMDEYNRDVAARVEFLAGERWSPAELSRIGQ